MRQDGWFRESLACSVSLAAVIAASPAFGQAPSPPESEASRTVDEVLVTGSRTIVNGAAAPTPLTVASANQLTAAQPGNLADAVVQLPVFLGSARPSSTGPAQSTGGAGANLLALRGLGSSRTLVLIDGRRVAPTTLSGSTDANLVPASLLSRVEVVTGGASAAYGSDAVAGVVNFALDSKFRGVKALAQGGFSTHRGDAQSQKFNLTYGASLADDRLHVVVSGDYFNQRGINTDYHGRGWADAGYSFIPVAQGSSQLILGRNVGDSLGSPGGTISACAPTTAACPIRLTQFRPDGSLAPFVQGANASTAVAQGGDGAKRRTNLLPSLETKILFGRATMDVSDSLTVFVEGNYGHMQSDYIGSTAANQAASGNAFTIFADNAYLPAPVRAVMAANGITAFTLNRVHTDFSKSRSFTDTETYRLVGGLHGTIGDTSWRYSAYAQYGDAVTHINTTNNVIVNRIFNAADAVVNPANGQIVCRSTLLNTVAGPGCVPINLFGSGVPSAAAVAYVTGVSDVRIEASQLELAADMRGELFSLWSDPVSVAFGGEYRRERGQVTQDPIGPAIRDGAGIRGFPASQQGLVGGYNFGINGLPLKGSYNIKEAFVEVNVPVFKDRPLFRRLDINTAARYADYSTAGGQTTWKLGAIWEPVEGFRIPAPDRATSARRTSRSSTRSAI